MRFDDRFLEDLKARIVLSDLIGKAVQLKRQGGEMAGLSPFTKEKTPSFFVNDRRQFFHDFSSGKHGDAITWLMEYERLDFREAVAKLADLAGVPLPARDDAQIKVDADRENILNALAAASLWYQEQLRGDSQEAAVARVYLDERGVCAEEIGRFAIGYAPLSAPIQAAALIERGFSEQMLIDAGMLKQPDGHGKSPFARFRGRVMFPIRDIRGRVISFGGRILPGAADRKAKYLNGPETAVFDKGANLYGLQEALAHGLGGAAAARALVVEGYLDVIATFRAGLPAVAPMGTSLSLAQLDTLWRRGIGVDLCFDGDKAGLQAARRACDLLLPGLQPERTPRFISIAGCKDPDEVVRVHGAEALRELARHPISLSEVLMQTETAGRDFGPPETRVALRRRVRALAARISDQELSAAFDVDLQVRCDRFFDDMDWKATKGSATRPTAIARPGGTFTPTLPLVPASLVAAGIRHPHWLFENTAAIRAHHFGSDKLRGVAVEVADFMDQVPDNADWSAMPSLKAHLVDAGFEDVLGECDICAATLQAPYGGAASNSFARRAWLATLQAVGRVYELDGLYDFTDASVAAEIGTESFRRLKTERDGLRASITSRFIWHELSLEDDIVPEIQQGARA